MAVGDVISGISLVTAGGNLDYQPASGVEVMIVNIAGDAYGTYAHMAKLYDGTNEADIMAVSEAAAAGGGKILITNSRYLRITNGDGTSSRVLGYTGIQIK